MKEFTLYALSFVEERYPNKRTTVRTQFLSLKSEYQSPATKRNLPHPRLSFIVVMITLNIDNQVDGLET